MWSEADKRILRPILIGGAVILAALLYYSWVTNDEAKSMDDRIASLKEQSKAKEAELTEIKRWESRAPEIEDIVKDLQEKVKRLPRTVEASDFFRILRDCVLMTNLTDISVGRVKRANMGAYEEIPYVIDCRARYHELGQFLAIVEQHSQQIMRVRRLDILEDVGRPSRHKVSMEIATFVFTEQIPPAPLPPAREVTSK